MSPKKKKVKKATFKGIDLEIVKAKLATLQQGNRFREAIVYAYYNYMLLVQGQYNIARRPSQTAREYAMDLVKRVKLPPAKIYPFTTLYEEARFGKHEISPDKYSNALQMFLNLHDLVIGGPKQVGNAASSR
jgi:hypothetical protein